MENVKMSAIILILSIVGSGLATEYFTGLNIDQNLLTETNYAMTDLSNTLNANFDCYPRRQRNDENFNLKRQRMLYQTYQHHQFRKFSGYGGYDSTRPQAVCKDTYQRKGIFSSICQKIINVSKLLLRVRAYLIQYNNIIIGDNNSVDGSKNLIIGSRNSLTGNNDWVFASDYHSTNPQDEALILGNYLIQLDELKQCQYKINDMVHCIKQQESNKQFKNFWGKAARHHRYCF